MVPRMSRYYLLSILIIVAGAVGADERMVGADAFSASVFEAASNAERLHRLNINDVDGLKSNLQKDVAIGVVTLWSTIQSGGISDEEKARAFGVLLLIAVQNEKFPNRELNSDKNIVAILEDVLKSDPDKTTELRSRNWERPWWVK